MSKHVAQCSAGPHKRDRSQFLCIGLPLFQAAVCLIDGNEHHLDIVVYDYKGRRQSVDLAAIRELSAQGAGPTEVARLLGISRMAVYRATRPQRSLESSPRIPAGPG